VRWLSMGVRSIVRGLVLLSRRSRCSEFMTRTLEGAEMAMIGRLEQFKTESPGAGETFPEVSVQVLDGGSWSSSDAAGRVVVLQTGSFT
jgi:hypothetical protein